MMKKLKRYFLPFCILLSGGYGGIFAGSGQKYISDSLTKILEKAEIANFAPLLNSQLPAYKFTVPGTEKDHHRIYAEENKEVNDEFVFVNRYVEIRNYFTIFYRRVAVNFCDIKKNLCFRAHYAYFSSSLYILLQVIRI